jgi:hypothetical protein
MTILGLLLMVLGLVTGITGLWTIGMLLVIVGVVLWLFGRGGHTVGGRQHYF